MIAVDIVALAALTVLLLLGVHRVVLVAALLRARRTGRTPQSSRDREPQMQDNALPAICVQLPMFNERAVAERLVEAVCRQDYPHDRLSIQILDDSDERGGIDWQASLPRWRATGARIEVFRRHHRDGFKAGALSAGLRQSDAPFVAVFDADFIPPTDFSAACHDALRS